MTKPQLKTPKLSKTLSPLWKLSTKHKKKIIVAIELYVKYRFQSLYDFKNTEKLKNLTEVFASQLNSVI